MYQSPHTVRVASVRHAIRRLVAGRPRPRQSVALARLLAPLAVLMLVASPASASPRAAVAVGSAAPAAAAAPRLAARGDRSGVVATVQAALMAAGIDLVGGADGVFGRYTEAAVRRFQTDHGLAADGVVGPDTADALGLTDWGVIELRRGSTGSPVAHVQGVLMATGIDLVGGADGVFGRYTEAAVRRFQTDHGLAADGVVGPDTADALGLTDWASWSTGSSAGQTPSGGDGPVFPTRPSCTFSDTFGAPRPNGRTHEGVDIMAPKGAPVYAMYPGTITKITRAESGSIAGNAVRVSRADGSYVFYAHLDTFSTAAVVGTTVTAGEVLGTVGRTGNAATPHLHLELHPGGGAAINPYPVVRTLVNCT